MLISFSLSVGCPPPCTQRFAAWRSGGFIPQMLIRSTQFKFTKNCHTKHITRHYAKPLLPAGVLSVVSWKSSLIRVSLFAYCFCVGCVLADLKILEGKEILKNNFSVGKGESSFAIFGLRVGLCELQMCLHLCDGFTKDVHYRQNLRIYHCH